MISLNKQAHKLSKTAQQLEVLESLDLPTFESSLRKSDLFPLKPTRLEVFQINLGKMCNQVCKHCHVDAGPDRKEIMTREVMVLCLEAIKKSGASTVDLTGGAPEMNPDFRWFVAAISSLGKHIVVRCNLTIILANPKYHDLPAFFKKHQVEVVSSLPYFTATRTDAQRGDGVFDKSIQALKLLNAVGYGMEGTGLQLNLVYNPSGAFLPGEQQALENEFKAKLKSRFEIHFNELYAITNIPVSRFLDYLISSDNYEAYMETLVSAYNATAAEGVMCRNTISVGWDGYLFDCDFNQMLDLKLKEDNHISQFDLTSFQAREIIVNQHCYGCTAGAGSSCGGTTA